MKTARGWLVVLTACLFFPSLVGAQTPVYFSVGTSTADLKSSPALSVTFAGGIATFSEAQADNIGVGDEITYNTSNKAYISARTSPTVFSVRTRVGAIPTNVLNATVNSIRRSFNTLTAAESGAADGTHLNQTDLVAGGFQLHLACYADGPMDDSAISIDGWTTGPNNYIRIFTPSQPTEVGRSQRHNGVAGTGFRLRRIADLSATSPFYYFRIFEEYTRLEGIELDGSALTNGQVLIPIRLESSLLLTSDVRIDKMLVHDFVNSTVNPGLDTDVFGVQVQNGNVKISNSIFYHFDQVNTNVSSGTDIIRYSSSFVGTSFVYANTIFDVKVSVANGNSAHGISGNTGTITLVNNVVMDVGSATGPALCFFGTFTENNNVSSDATAGGAGSQINKTAYTSYFRSVTRGSEDLHLRNDSKALWGSDGADLDTDPNLPVVDDIDGQARHATTPDIGADEVSAAVTYSVGTYGGDLKSSPALTVTLVSGTATFSEVQASDIGVGDEVTYNGVTVAYIASRTSSTVYALRTAKGAVPPDVSGVSVGSITRAFGSLTAAQNGSFDANHLATQDLVAGNFQLHWACYDDGPLNDRLDLTGWTTGPANYIRIFAPGSVPTEVGASQRHTGVAGTGFRLAPVDATVQGYNIIVLRTPFVRIEGIEIDGSGLTAATAARGVNVLQGLPLVGDIRMDSNIIHGLHTTQGGANFDGSFGIYAFQQAANVGPPLLLTNNIIYDVTANTTDDNHHIGGIHIGSRTTSYVYNNTLYHIRHTGAPPAGAAWGIEVSAWPAATGTATVVARNNFVGDVSSDNDVENCFDANNGGVFNQSFNVSSDATAVGVTGQTAYATYFQNVTPGSEDLHLTADSNALWGSYATDLSSVFTSDVDGASRVLPWDIGADDTEATTAVELVTFTALPLDGVVELSWETGSEIENLGFHLYRAAKADGRYEQVTVRPVPGLGSSPEGARYRYRDTGVENGTVYFYELEDLDARGRTERHGPVSAMPREGLGSPVSAPPEPGSDAWLTFGEPERNTLRILSRSADSVRLELVTAGFYATPADDGSVTITIPGVEILDESGPRAIPVVRKWVEAIGGRQVHLGTIEVADVHVLDGLTPVESTRAELEATSRGLVRAARGRGSRRFDGRSLFPEEAARLVEVGFQGDTKKALVELAPLRWDAHNSHLLLTKRLTVDLSFRGREVSEHDVHGGRGRRYRPTSSQARRAVAKRLVTREAGLYVVSYEDLFGRRTRPLEATNLRLSRGGEPVAFHIEPRGARFGSGSSLYFLSGGARGNPFGDDAVYELEVGHSGTTMPVVDPHPEGPLASFSWEELEREENHYYQAALIDAPDLWLWEPISTSDRKSFSFDLQGLSSEPLEAELEIDLQGTSDLEVDPDHHLRASVNGVPVAEGTANGKEAFTLAASVPPGVLHEGENRLEIENVGDTGAAFSMVMLDRFRLLYPRRLSSVPEERLARFSSTATLALSKDEGTAFVLDVSSEPPRWMLPAGGGPVSRFAVEPGRRYRIVPSSKVRRAETANVAPVRWKRETNQADYVLIGPETLLVAAGPLASLRRSQGLSVAMVSTEEIYSEFGFGEPRPEAIRDFLAFAYHRWRSPSPRYVLLFGDATYDFKDYLGTGVKNQVPPMMVKTSFLWTASDPSYAAVNGDDPLPDLAIGRLPAANLEEARLLVRKILDYEWNLEARSAEIVLVADDADDAGDFPADAEALARRYLSALPLRRIYLSELGVAEARREIVDAFDDGAALLSYIGHGGIHLWANEDLLDTTAAQTLAPQPSQPLVLTMNCLNGYFHFPYFDSLSEALLKLDGRGAVAAFSPSGLSLNGPAQLYHGALLRELLSERHERLGDAVLAAQAAYADTGALPELLVIYHLLGDPALRLH